MFRKSSYKLRWFVTYALTLVVVARAGDTTGQQQEGVSLLARSMSVSNIRATGSVPFHLHITVKTEHITAKPLEGDYDEVWSAPDKWRREIVFPGLRQVEVGDKDSRWLDRNLDFRPHAVYLISWLVDSVVPPALFPEEDVEKVRTRKKDGMELRCMELKSVGSRRVLCFNGTGSLSSRDSDVSRFEYLDYGNFQGKQFPRTMLVFEDGHKVLEARVQTLEAASKIDATYLHPPATAKEMALCEPMEEQKPKKRVSPEYPQAARAAHQQGAVTMYALLGPDGAVQTVKILQSAGPALDKASVEAVKQWVFPPVRCGATPLPTEQEVRVRFTIGGPP